MPFQISLNRRRKLGFALMIGCFAMLVWAAQLIRGIKPAEHKRALLIMIWMLAGITGLIIGMVLVLAGKAPRRSTMQDESLPEPLIKTSDSQ